MKFEIKSKERGSKDFYDELFYVANKHDDFLRKPNKKIYRVTKFLLCVGIWSLILFAVCIAMCFFDASFINILCCVLCLFFIFISSISYKKYKDAINICLNSEGTSVFEMNKDGVKTNRIIDGSESTHEVKWDSIKHVIISKYSIFFINDDNMNPLFSLDIRHKEKVLEALKKLKKDDLVIE